MRYCFSIIDDRKLLEVEDFKRAKSMEAVNKRLALTISENKRVEKSVLSYVFNEFVSVGEVEVTSALSDLDELNGDKVCHWAEPVTLERSWTVAATRDSLSSLNA